MKKNRKPGVGLLLDNMGFFTHRCPDKETALRIMRAEIATDPAYYEEFLGVSEESITLERIQEERMYEHRKCELYALGDNTCPECLQPCGTNGRRTFVFYTV